MVSGNHIESPTRKLSEYIAAKRYEDIPEEIRERAKILILDSLGCAIGGSMLKPGKMILQFFENLGGTRESSVYATGKKIPCIHAAYVNSALANMLDMDDTLMDKGIGHPGASVVLPALSVAEKLGAGGREIINAVLLGYEIAVRILNALAPTPERRAQVWGMATFQIFGALAVSCKLLGLDADQVASAIGLAGFCAPVPFIRKLGTDERPTNWLKNNLGWASMGGVMSALQAAAGFQGSTSIFDGEKGFWIMAGSDRCDFDALTKGFDKDYQFMDKISFKYYAACRFTHTTLDALKKIKAENNVNPENIAKIEVKTFYEAYKFKTFRGLNIIEAQFSLPYVIALELLNRSPAHGLRDEDLEDNDVLNMADLVSLELDPKAENRFIEKSLMPSHVTITMKDGGSFSGSEDVPRGDIRKPLSDGEIKEKFRNIVRPLFDKTLTEKIIRACQDLDRSKGPWRIPTPLYET